MFLNLLQTRSKTTHKQPNIFYKTDEIRFKGFGSCSSKRLPRPQYLFESNPWGSISKQQIDVLFDRLEDQP